MLFTIVPVTLTKWKPLQGYTHLTVYSIYNYPNYARKLCNLPRPTTSFPDRLIFIHAGSCAHLQGGAILEQCLSSIH